MQWGAHPPSAIRCDDKRPLGVADAASGFWSGEGAEIEGQEIEELCQQIIETQEEEIRIMKDMLGED